MGEIWAKKISQLVCEKTRTSCNSREKARLRRRMDQVAEWRLSRLSMEERRKVERYLERRRAGAPGEELSDLWLEMGKAARSLIA